MVEEARGHDCRDRAKRVDRMAQSLVQGDRRMYEEPSATKAHDSHARADLYAEEGEGALCEPEIVTKWFEQV